MLVLQVLTDFYINNNAKLESQEHGSIELISIFMLGFFTFAIAAISYPLTKAQITTFLEN